MAQFVHNRRPQYKGTMGFEMERPSASYVIDVSSVDGICWNACIDLNHRCYHRLRAEEMQSILYRQDTCIRL